MSKQQLHKRLNNEQVKFILKQYLMKEISRKDVQEYLEIKKTRFFELVEEYRKETKNFSVRYKREKPTRYVDTDIEKNILDELDFDKKQIIDNPEVPTKRYNYSYIKNLLEKKYEQKVSLNTIIDRAKKHGFYREKRKRKVHDREVITNYVGELDQLDSSLHLWSPPAKEKWYLITHLDDHSRLLLYADLWEKETTLAHISASKAVFSEYGFPLSCYSDQHSIFRFVKNRDKPSVCHYYKKFTGDVLTQWQMVLEDCGVKAIHALSPQAKGKIERPYGWLQDHLVRTCTRENIINIDQARLILKDEVQEYNTRRVHSTTREIPIIRFRRAVEEGKTLFQPYEIKEPFKSDKDVFCVRIKRVVDAYRKVSINNLQLKISGVMPRQEVELRISPDKKTGLFEVRFWHKNIFKGAQRVDPDDLSTVHF